VLTYKYNRVKAGTSDIGTINSNDRIAATMYSLGTLFVSGIYVVCVNTLHKGDNDDDDDNNNSNNNKLKLCYIYIYIFVNGRISVVIFIVDLCL
jgi:hypothetical protein